MKTLLFGLLSLQLALVISGNVYGTQEKKTRIERTMSMIELPTEEKFKKPIPGAKSGPEPTPAVTTSFDHRKELLANLERLQAKFGSKTIQFQEGVIDDMPYDGKIIEIDISYPSFLNFIYKRSQELRGKKSVSEDYISKIDELTKYILETIEGLNADNSDKFFEQLFSTEESEKKHQEYIALSKKYETFFTSLRSKFKEHIKNITTQQRIKTLLILRQITNLGLNEDFDVGKLLRIELYPDTQSSTRVTSKGKEEGKYRLYLALLSEKDSDMITTTSKVLTPNTDETRDFTYSAFLHELTHIYHHVIGSPFYFGGSSKYELMPISWKFDDVIRLFNPWYYEELCERARKLLEEYVTNAEKKYPSGIVEELLSFYRNEWPKKWTHLEEILTIIGIVPIDLSIDGKIVRYRVLDRQNESAEMNRGNGTYRLLYSDLTSLAQELFFYLSTKFKENSFVQEEWENGSRVVIYDPIIYKSIELILQALRESGYNLYATGQDIEPDSIKMQEAETEFLKVAAALEPEAERLRKER